MSVNRMAYQSTTASKQRHKGVNTMIYLTFSKGDKE